jgi:hypothetical protein
MLGRPTSAKGHARRLLSAYVTLLDRELRLAEAIGFGRQSSASTPTVPGASELRALRDALGKEPLYPPGDPAVTSTAIRRGPTA